MYTSTKTVNEFKVNKFMRKRGFVWDIYPGIKAVPRQHSFNGSWRKDNLSFSQEQAVYIYKSLRKKWWLL